MKSSPNPPGVSQVTGVTTSSDSPPVKRAQSQSLLDQQQQSSTVPPPAAAGTSHREKQADEYSTTNTESLINGSSAGVNLLDHGEEIKPHPAYLLPPKVTHPLEDNFGWVFLRGCAFHLAGLFVGLPLFLIILICVCIICPIRLLLWVFGSIFPFCAPLRRLASLSSHSCHLWWPLSTYASPHASLVQCIVTLQSPIDIDEARRHINENVFALETVAAGDGDIELGSLDAAARPRPTAYNRRIEGGQGSMLERLVSASGSSHISRDYLAHFTQLQSPLDECCRPRTCNVPSMAPTNHQRSVGSVTNQRASLQGVSAPKPAPLQAHDYAYHVSDHVTQTHLLNRCATPCAQPGGTSTCGCATASEQQLDAASTNSHSVVLTTAAPPNGRRSRIASLRDLESYVNYPIMKWSKRKPAWCIKLLPQFGNVEDLQSDCADEDAFLEGTCCALVLIEMQSSLSDALCPLRFLSLWTDGGLSFDVEPKYRRSFLFGGVLPPYNIFLTISYTLWTICQAVSASPLCLLLGALRHPEPVWSYSPTGASFSRPKLRDTSCTATNRRYRGQSTATNGSGGIGADRRQSASLASSALIGFGLAPSFKRVTWARISNMDQLLRAERILRASTIELLLAFVAGALRRHFRSQGIRHPPNVRIVVPVSNRDYLPVSQHESCDFILVPVQIPVGIEGNIPRIWAVQRALADALDEPFPLGAKIARFFGKLLLPEWTASNVQRQAYNDTACCVSFIRASGDASLHSRRIHSVLCYSPVPEDCRAAFGFIQCGTEMVVTLTADTRLFAEPDTLLAFFQAEVLSLLRQLSVRLLTLTQATYLPPCNMQNNAAPSPPCDESPMVSAGASSERPLLTATCNASASASAVSLSPMVGGANGDDSCSSVSVPLTPCVTVEYTIDSHNDAVFSPSAQLMPEQPSAQQQARQRSMSRSSRTSRSLFIEVPAPTTRRSSSSFTGDANESATLEELEMLLATVQHELDTMKANPQVRGDRSEYVLKLAELEHKMEEFHKTIARRLGPRLTAAAEASVSQPNIAVVDEMLAPYREEERALAERRASRDSRRSSINVMNRMIRKRSSTRRMDSPTRRLSPRGSLDSLHPGAHASGSRDSLH